jgi:acyl dehydratase
VPLNRAFIGRTSPPSEPFLVGREHIRQFAKAIGDDNPHYHDVEAARAAGYPDVIAPPTFLITLGFRRGDGTLADPDLGLNYALVVHGEQKFVHYRPVVAGDELVGTGRVADIRDAGRNELMTVEQEITTTGGERVALAINTIVSRGTAAPKEA